MASTVLVVDDHAVFRSFARAMLEEEGYRVVGEAEDGASAVDLARRLQPDIVLLDIALPDFDGFTVCAEITGSEAAPVVILTSTRAISAYGHQLKQSRARGFIAKADLSGPALAALAG